MFLQKNDTGSPRKKNARTTLHWLRAKAGIEQKVAGLRLPVSGFVAHSFSFPNIGSVGVLLVKALFHSFVSWRAVLVFRGIS